MLTVEEQQECMQAGQDHIGDWLCWNEDDPDRFDNVRDYGQSAAPDMGLSYLFCEGWPEDKCSAAADFIYEGMTLAISEAETAVKEAN